MLHSSLRYRSNSIGNTLLPLRTAPNPIMIVFCVAFGGTACMMPWAIRQVLSKHGWGACRVRCKERFSYDLSLIHI